MSLALGACSAIKLGYNNLNSVAYWWLDSYIDFTDPQTTQVRDDLARLHLWHRTQELPRFVAMLRSMEELAPRDVSAARACDFIPLVRERIRAVADRAESQVTALAMRLAPEQLAHLEHKYDKINATYRKEWVMLDKTAQRDKRTEQFIDRSEMVYGTLQDSQRQALRKQMEISVFDPARNLAERQRRQGDLLQTLRKLSGTTTSEATTLLRGYIDRFENSPDSAYRTYQKALQDESCRDFSALHNSTSAAQREAAARRLRAYQRDLRELAAHQ